ncbi:MAG: c-type cytochrome [Nitrospirae bacterium]|nr:c-type cytochrome [Nitrospirota bacterium]
MQKLVLTGMLAALLFLSACVLYGKPGGEKSGKDLFAQNCSGCHPDGGNILNPRKTLHGKDLEANNIKTPRDIVKKMRNPGPDPTHPQDWAGMRMFDEKAISDDDALKIANYILETFK